MSIRGTGDSEGVYQYLSDDEIDDGCHVVEWAAAQDWCDGNVGMFGVSYFARIQYFVATRQPPHLRCIFAPWASTDQYRDTFYHGGILNRGWMLYWSKSSLRNTRHASESSSTLGSTELDARLAQLRYDPELSGDPELAAVLAEPELEENRMALDVLLNSTYTDFWKRRTVAYERIAVPVYMGADWSNYGLHLPGAFRSWDSLAHVPRRMIIGPTPYLDRPLYQLQYESLRWFDRWLKGVDVGLDDAPPVNLFVEGTGRWKRASEWPLPEAQWTPFYLHERGRLWERENFPNGGSTSFSDSPWGREAIEFSTPPLVEETEVIGPLVLRLWASTTDDEVLWFVSLREVTAGDEERILTRGWLRGTHRAIDPERSTPWLPYHPHSERDAITPGEIEQYTIPIVPTAKVFAPGSRIKLKISCVDDPAENALQAIASGHLRRRMPARITVFHSREHPSELLIPVTDGNVLGTFLSGGGPYVRR